MNQVTVMFFATLRDRTGVKSIDVELPSEASVTTLKNALAKKLPVLSGMWSYSLVAVNHEFVLATGHSWPPRFP